MCNYSPDCSYILKIRPIFFYTHTNVLFLSFYYFSPSVIWMVVLSCSSIVRFMSPLWSYIHFFSTSAFFLFLPSDPPPPPLPGRFFRMRGICDNGFPYFGAMALEEDTISLPSPLSFAALLALYLLWLSIVSDTGDFNHICWGRYGGMKVFFLSSNQRKCIFRCVGGLIRGSSSVGHTRVSKI